MCLRVEGHFEPEDPVTYSSASVGFTYMSSWLESPLPTTRFTQESFALEVERKTLAVVTHGGSTFDFSGIGGAKSGFDVTTVDFPAVVVATPPGSLDLANLVNTMVTPLESLLWVATGRFSETDLHVRIDGDPPEYVRVWTSPLRPKAHETPTRRLIRQEMLFTASDMPDGLEGGLSRWLDVWPDLQPALGPVMARQRAPFSYSDDRFASAVAGLESYSALRHGERDIPKDERNVRIAVVKDALEQGAPDYVEWVLEALERAHRHTLRSRLDRLLDEAGPLSNALVGLHRTAFVSAVIRSRDQVAHSLERKGGLGGGAAIHWASRGFVWLIRYLAMVELGFSIEDSRRLVLGDHIFQQEAKLLQRTLSAAETAE